MNKAKIIIKKIEGEEVKVAIKSIHASLKVVEEKDDRWIVEGYASVFGNVDSYGEVVDKGAFQEWLAAHPADPTTGIRRFPKFVRFHNWERPLGPTIYCEEDEIGLKVRGELLKEVQDAREEYALIKSGASTDLSFGFRVRGDAIDANTGFRHLTKIDIFEWSPVLVGANPKATITNIKSDGQVVEEDAPEAPADETPAEETPSTDAPSDENTPAAGDTPAPEEETPSPVAGDDAGDQPEGDTPAGEAPADDDEKSLKAGRVLSSKNRNAIQSACDAMKAATDALEALLDATEDDDSGKSSDTSKVETHEGKGTPERLVLKGILRDARKADKILEKVIIRAKTL